MWCLRIKDQTIITKNHSSVRRLIEKYNAQIIGINIPLTNKS